MQLLERIGESLSELSPSLRKLGELVLRDYQSVAFMTVQAISQKADVSTASVMRFAQTLGFDGFSDLQKEIRRITRQDLQGPDRMSLGEAVYGETESRVSTHVGKALENIQTLMKRQDEKDFTKAVELLGSSSRIVVAGARSTSYLAEHLVFGLTKIGLDCSALTEMSESDFQRINALPHNSCLILIGFSRYVRHLVELKDFARGRGIPVISITDSIYSPLSADITLEVSVESVSFMAFHSAPLILISALLEEVSGLDRDRTLAALHKFELLAKARALFLSAPKRSAKQIQQSDDPDAEEA